MHEELPAQHHGSRISVMSRALARFGINVIDQLVVDVRDNSAERRSRDLSVMTLEVGRILAIWTDLNCALDAATAVTRLHRVVAS